MRGHIMSCPDFHELYQADPAKALDPEDEYVRYQEWLKSDEGQAAMDEKAADKSEGYRKNAERILDRERARWGGKPLPMRGSVTPDE